MDLGELTLRYTALQSVDFDPGGQTMEGRLDGEPRYVWLNTTFAVVEGSLSAVKVGGEARGRLHECRPTIGAA